MFSEASVNHSVHGRGGWVIGLHPGDLHPGGSAYRGVCI